MLAAAAGECRPTFLTKTIPRMIALAAISQQEPGLPTLLWAMDKLRWRACL